MTQSRPIPQRRAVLRERSEAPPGQKLQSLTRAGSLAKFCDPGRDRTLFETRFPAVDAALRPPAHF